MPQNAAVRRHVRAASSGRSIIETRLEPTAPSLETGASRFGEEKEKTRSRDYMHIGYNQIREPLNLCDRGQSWFSKVYENNQPPDGGCGLVLGATPWLARLVSGFNREVMIADMSPVMLKCAEDVLVGRSAAGNGRFHLIEANWTKLPPSDQLSVVVGDNAFSYLPYPDEWTQLCDQLTQRMTSGARIIIRMCSAPHGHTRLSVCQIVDEFLAADTMNYTEVRAALLFAHRDDRTYSIDTEAVLDTFERNERRFAPLFERFPLTADDDLLTIKKYRGANATYFAPPLAEIIGLLERHFRVDSVHFGPYKMSKYFPLVVASLP